MKAVLLNSTREIDHIGCQLTSIGLIKFLTFNGFDIVAEVPFKSDNLASTIEYYRKLNVVFIVNGEGTFHSNQPECVRLINCLDRLEHRCALINSQYFKISSELSSRISLMPFVALRTELDRDEALSDIPQATFLPDMIFNSFEISHTEAICEKILISDSHLQGLNYTDAYKILADDTKGWLSINVHRPGEVKTGFRRNLEKLRLLLCPTEQNLNKYFSRTANEVFSELGKCSHLITGRYHLACLSIMAGKPVQVVPTNTPKLSRLMHSFCDSIDGVHYPKEKVLDTIHRQISSFSNLKSLFND